MKSTIGHLSGIILESLLPWQLFFLQWLRFLQSSISNSSGRVKRRPEHGKNSKENGERFGYLSLIDHIGHILFFPLLLGVVYFTQNSRRRFHLPPQMDPEPTNP